MTVTVQFYSYLRETAGRAESAVELDPGATVADALARLYERYPRLQAADANILVAIGTARAQRTDRLQDGDVIALMPPFQGGSAADELLVTEDPIADTEAAATVGSSQTGGVAIFWGTVRGEEDGDRIRALDYTAYREMAEQEFRQILADTRGRWPVQRVRVVHRLGVIPVGEASLLVRVETAHRAEAFAAAQFIIDELKQRVPIWKQAVR